MAKFKVGDRVKIVSRRSDNSTGFFTGWSVCRGGDGCIGRVGYVTHISDGRYYVNEDPKYIGTSFMDNYYGMFNDEELELVEEEKTNPTIFKDEDRVKIISGTCDHGIGYSVSYDGDVDVVELVDKSTEEIIYNDTTHVNKEGEHMDLLKKFADALMGEPERSLQKYEITDSRGNLTSGGRDLYINWKFKADLEAFQKDVLAVLIKADKKTKKDEE